MKFSRIDSSFHATLRCGMIALFALSCRRAAPEPDAKKVSAVASAKAASEADKTNAGESNAKAGESPVGLGVDPVAVQAAKPRVEVPVTPGDPEAGDFTLEEALQGLPGSESVVAEIHTDAGKLECELYSDKAPITVANFIGLARGKRAWLEKGTWVKKPLYDGTVFHRVIKGFMIQGGDPNHNGSGGPGYVIQDEIWAGAQHDTRGQICMANRGRNTNGSQFFIMDGKAAHLDGGYTIFGKCGPEAVIDKLANSEVRGDQAVKPPVITRVTVRRTSAK